MYLPRNFIVRWVGCALFASLAAIVLPPASWSQVPVTHLYSVPPGGMSQFPVRNGPATAQYLSFEKYMGIDRAVPSSFWRYSLKDEKGNAVSLETLRGKVIVLDFWGTACGACLRAMPHLGRMAQSYHARNVVFLSVCESPDFAGFQSRAAQFHSPGLHFLFDSAPGGMRGNLRGLLHNGMGQPTQLIINRTGVLVGALQGYDDVSDPDMKVLRQSVDTAMRPKIAAFAP